MKILFIGNSHTYFHHLPARFARCLADHGVSCDAVMLCKGGMGLDWHAVEPQTAYNLTFGGYDAVVLQHVAHPFPGKDSLIDGAKAVDGFIPRGTKKFMYMTWTEKNNPDGQAAMSAAYDECAKAIGAEVCPVGRIWWEVARAHPCEELYFVDGEHASTLGSSLAAVVIARTVLGLPVDDAELCYEEAQRIAAWPDPPTVAFTARGVESVEG